MRRNRYQPRLDLLETRCLPSCTVSESAGVLTILGDNRRNDVQITDDGTNQPGAVRVVCDGQTVSSAGGIGDLRIQTRGGRDVVGYNVASGLSTRVVRALHLDLGADNDRFQANLAGALTNRSYLDLNVNGGPGSDTIVWQGFGAAISPTATMRLFTAAGDDNDRVNASCQVKVEGRLLFRAEGNPGIDRVAADFLLLAGSTGQATPEIRGGTNVDTLRLTLHKQDPADSAMLSGLADGGQSIDLCRHTANVRVEKCELTTLVS